MHHGERWSLKKENKMACTRMQICCTNSQSKLTLKETVDKMSAAYIEIDKRQWRLVNFFAETCVASTRLWCNMDHKICLLSLAIFIGSEQLIAQFKWALWLNHFTTIPLRLHTLPYWFNPPFFISDIRALWRSGLSDKSARMSKIKNGGLDQYGAEPFKQQQFGTSGVERVKL